MPVSELRDPFWCIFNKIKYLLAVFVEDWGCGEGALRGHVAIPYGASHAAYRGAARHALEHQCLTLWLLEYLPHVVHQPEGYLVALQGLQ